MVSAKESQEAHASTSRRHNQRLPARRGLWGKYGRLGKMEDAKSNAKPAIRGDHRARTQAKPGPFRGFGPATPTSTPTAKNPSTKGKAKKSQLQNRPYK